MLRIPDPLVGCVYDGGRKITKVNRDEVYYTMDSWGKGLSDISVPRGHEFLRRNITAVPDYLTPGCRFNDNSVIAHPYTGDLEAAACSNGRTWASVIDSLANGKLIRKVTYVVRGDDVVETYDGTGYQTRQEAVDVSTVWAVTNAGIPMRLGRRYATDSGYPIFPSEQAARDSIVTEKTGYRAEGDHVIEVKYKGNPVNVFPTRAEAETYTRGSGFIVREETRIVPVTWHWAGVTKAHFVVVDNGNPTAALTKADVLTEEQAIAKVQGILAARLQRCQVAVGQKYKTNFTDYTRTVTKVEGDIVHFTSTGSRGILSDPISRFLAHGKLVSQ